LVGFGSVDNFGSVFGEVANISRIDSDASAAGFNSSEYELRLKMDICHDWNRGAFNDGWKSFDVFLLGDSYSNDVASSDGQFADLDNGRVNIVGFAGSHRLNGNGSVAADRH
jgi:hypothetical protein